MANSIPVQASVRVHKAKPRGGEGQSIRTSGWPCSKSGRKNKMKKESRKLSPALGNGSATGTRWAQDLAPVYMNKWQGNRALGTLVRIVRGLPRPGGALLGSWYLHSFLGLAVSPGTLDPSVPALGYSQTPPLSGAGSL